MSRITVKKPKYVDEIYVIDSEAKRGSFLREERVTVTFAAYTDRDDAVGIGWGLVRGVDVHPELLAETLRQLGYRVEKP